MTEKNKELEIVQECDNSLIVQDTDCYIPTTKKGNKNVESVKFSKKRCVYGYYYDQNTKQRQFGVVETREFYDDIQSFKDSTDIKQLKEFLLADSSNQLTDDMFADVSFVANDLLTNLVNADASRDMFNSLPSSVKELYGNDIYRFAKEYDFEKVKELFKAKQEEVKPNEEV